MKRILFLLLFFAGTILQLQAQRDYVVITDTVRIQAFDGSAVLQIINSNYTPGEALYIDAEGVVYTDTIGASGGTLVDSISYVNDTLYLYQAEIVLKTAIPLPVIESDTLYLKGDSICGVNECVLLPSAPSMGDVDTLYIKGDSICGRNECILIPNIYETISVFDTNGIVISNIGLAADVTTNDFVFGSPQLNDDGNALHDNRMFFDKSKGAFRAGSEGGTNWDEVNIGEHSIGIGKGQRSSGSKSAAVGGEGAIVTGTRSTSFGGLNLNISGQSAFGGGGEYNISAGVGSVTLGGSNNSTPGWYSAALSGRFNTAQSYAEVSIGLYSTNYTAGSVSAIVGTDRVFNIGIGTGTGTRADAFTVLKNGKTGIGFNNFETTADAEILQVNGDCRADNYVGGFFIPISSTDAAAPNNSIYFSTDASRLVYKDAGGGINNLY